MTGSRNSPILAAYTAELDAFDQAVFAVAARFGGDQYGLIESRLALEGFMASMVMPYAFTPTLTKGQLETLLKNAYTVFSGHAEPSVVIMDVAWLRRLKQIAEARGAAPYVEKLVTTKFVSDLNAACEAKSIIYPTLDQAALEALKNATLTCIKAAITWRLKDADITPDFAEIASNTAAAIVFYSIITRVTQHGFAHVLRPFEELLREGLLVLGQEKGANDTMTVHAFQLYKEPENTHGHRSSTPRQTIASDLGSANPRTRQAPDGTIMGVGGPQPIEPRVAFVQAIQTMATARGIEDQQILNEAFRLWSGFMRTHGTAQGFLLGAVKDEDSLRNIIATATGNMATHLVILQVPALLELAEEFAHAAEEEREDRRVIIGRGKPTVRNIAGNRLWNDPYRNEAYVLDPKNPERIASHELRKELRALLEAHLMPSLDASLLVAGLQQSGVREVVATTVQHTFFNLFDAALHLMHTRVLAAARLAQVHVEGVIPLGFRGHAGQAFCRVLAA